MVMTFLTNDAQITALKSYRQQSVLLSINGYALEGYKEGENVHHKLEKLVNSYVVIYAK